MNNEHFISSTYALKLRKRKQIVILHVESICSILNIDFQKFPNYMKPYFKIITYFFQNLPLCHDNNLQINIILLENNDFLKAASLGTRK